MEIDSFLCKEKGRSLNIYQLLFLSTTTYINNGSRENKGNIYKHAMDKLPKGKLSLNWTYDSAWLWSAIVNEMKFKIDVKLFGQTNDNNDNERNEKLHRYTVIA